MDNPLFNRCIAMLRRSLIVLVLALVPDSAAFADMIGRITLVEG